MSHNFRDEESIERVLRRNIGRVCTVFTETGGRAGEGFTGVVADVNEDSCRVITSLPSMGELNPFGRDDDEDDDDRRCCRRRRRCRDRDDIRGTSLTIPLDRITCVATSVI